MAKPGQPIIIEHRLPEVEENGMVVVNKHRSSSDSSLDECIEAHVDELMDYKDLEMDHAMAGPSPSRLIPGGERNKRLAPSRLIPKHFSQRSYFQQFEKLFLSKPKLVEHVKEMALKGKSKGFFAFRHLVWRCCLGLLGNSLSDWEALMASHRSKYKALKTDYTCDERNDLSLHPALNNPLSQDEKSPWNKYFADSNLIETIDRDVQRTSPEIEFFKSKSIRRLMTNILFIYAKQHPDLEYRQGMHEILAAIILLHKRCIHEFHIHSEALDPGRPELLVLQEVNNPIFLEHDCYSMFEKVMEHMWDWYYVAPEMQRSQERLSRRKAHPDRPFESRDYPSDGLSGAAERLQSMWDNLLQLHDKELYDHLSSLMIIPTTFGLNWTKLLFSRQFKSYEVIWDVVMASSFLIVDFLLVAMVIAIRGMLLQGDDSQCNQWLVSKYPENVDIQFVIALALHLQQPLEYPKPRYTIKLGLQYLQSISKIIDSNKKPKAESVPKSSHDFSSAANDSRRKVEDDVKAQKMVDIAGSSELGDDGFEILGFEQSPNATIDSLRHDMRSWKSDLSTALRRLSIAVTNGSQDQRLEVEALDSIRTVIREMGDLLETLHGVPDMIGDDAAEAQAIENSQFSPLY